jgi:hypothetical protein
LVLLRDYALFLAENNESEKAISIAEKDANLTKVTEHKYVMVSSPIEWGGTMQQTYTIEFPEVATNVKVDTDAYGNTIFKFDMESPSGCFNLLRLSGLALMVVGGVWTGGKLISKKS